MLTGFWLFIWKSNFHCFGAVGVRPWALTLPNVLALLICSDYNYCIAQEQKCLKRYGYFFIWIVKNTEKTVAHTEVFLTLTPQICLLETIWKNVFSCCGHTTIFSHSEIIIHINAKTLCLTPTLLYPLLGSCPTHECSIISLTCGDITLLLSCGGRCQREVIANLKNL